MLRRMVRWALALWMGWQVLAETPPAVPREFRGLWIATVGNIDWPSKPGLPVAQQQEELRQIIEGAARLHLNVVVFQVRTCADALYDSRLEPWSEYLSGRMGQAPMPFWDPLRFAINEAHSRGLELHAWFNPFRARYHASVSAPSANHVTHTHPEWLRRFGRYLWMDPGDPAVRDHVLKVILDVVRRYDVDGIHIDDYFYPYPEVVPGTKTPATFTDEVTHRFYQSRGGQLEREDWRRDNVNQFVQLLNGRIHSIKPWVKFGISPFGIWRPNSPAGIKGLDAYSTLYADARLWLRKGWADYFAPQLYWPTGRREQDYGRLLEWWAGENTQGRLLVPGLAAANVGKDRSATDIVNQVRLRRSQPGTHGSILWNASSIRTNLGGLTAELSHDLLSKSALPPAVPWLGLDLPARPTLDISTSKGGASMNLRWRVSGGDAVRRWVVQIHEGESWRTEILGGAERRWDLNLVSGQGLPDQICLRAVGRTGGLGEAAIWRRPNLLEASLTSPRGRH